VFAVKANTEASAIELSLFINISYINIH